MKTPSAYLLAKYIPDLGRMEPRNIGVILWANGKTACRFLDADEAAQFVNERATYERWIAFWTQQLSNGEVRLPRGPAIPVDSVDFLPSLKSTQKDNYVLEDGGVLLEKLPARQVRSAVDFLFGELVATHPTGLDRSRHAARKHLRAGARRILERIGLTTMVGYEEPKDVECSFQGVPQRLRFHHYLGNGKPQLVIQRVSVEQNLSVNGTAWMFERVKETYEGIRVGAFIDTSGLDSLPTVPSSVNILASLGTVLDLSSEDAALATATQTLVPVV